MANPRGAPACKPGCNCRKHRPNHKPDCPCRPCVFKRNGGIPGKRNRGEYIRPKELTPDRCKCGHIQKRHDDFGCLICEQRGKLCSEFRRHDAPNEPQDNAIARTIAKLGFAAHANEFATCTNCWQTVKIGFGHSITASINAKAHAVDCHKRKQNNVRNSSPNRAG